MSPEYTELAMRAVPAHAGCVPISLRDSGISPSWTSARACPLPLVVPYPKSRSRPASQAIPLRGSILPYPALSRADSIASPCLSMQY